MCHQSYRDEYNQMCDTFYKDVDSCQGHQLSHADRETRPINTFHTLSRRTSIFFITDKGLKRRRWQQTDSEHVTTLHKSHGSLWSDGKPKLHLQLLVRYRGLVRERNALTVVLSVKQKPAEYHSTVWVIYSLVFIVIFGLEVIQKSQKVIKLHYSNRPALPV